MSIYCEDYNHEYIEQPPRVFVDNGWVVIRAGENNMGYKPIDINLTAEQAESLIGKLFAAMMKLQAELSNNVQLIKIPQTDEEFGECE